MRFRWFLVAGFVVAMGCSSKSGSGSSDGDLRVPECESYAQRAATCFHQADVAGLVVTRAHDPAERDRMAAKCTQSMQRLNTSCR